MDQDREQPMSAEPQLLDPFGYIAPTGDMVIRRGEVSRRAHELYQAIIEEVPPSEERTIAIRKLREARMWANAAIVIHGRTYPL